MDKLSGSCHCKQVQYQVLAPVKKVVNCHCNLCRGMNGSAFSTYAAVLTTDFELLEGTLSKFQVSESATKYFCGDCGTPIYNLNPKLKGLTILHYGSINNCNSLTPELNIFCGSEVNWLTQIESMVNLPAGIG